MKFDLHTFVMKASYSEWWRQAVLQTRVFNDICFRPWNNIYPDYIQIYIFIIPVKYSTCLLQLRGCRSGQKYGNQLHYFFIIPFYSFQFANQLCEVGGERPNMCPNLIYVWKAPQVQSRKAHSHLSPWRGSYPLGCLWQGCLRPFQRQCSPWDPHSILMSKVIGIKVLYHYVIIVISVFKDLQLDRDAQFTWNLPDQLTNHLSSLTSFLSWFTSISALSLSVRSSTFMTGILCQQKKPTFSARYSNANTWKQTHLRANKRSSSFPEVLLKNPLSSPSICVIK